jgi:hypothetical protein
MSFEPRFFYGVLGGHFSVQVRQRLTSLPAPGVFEIHPESPLATKLACGKIFLFWTRYRKDAGANLE